MMYEITIPVLNEEKKIVEKIDQIIGFLKENKLDNFKLVIVDNGSTDATKELGAMLASKHENVDFFSITEKGIGRALLHSWSISSSEIIGYMDLDLSTDLRHLIDVYNIFSEHNHIEIVNGSRLLKSSTVLNRKIIREIISRAFNKLMKNKLKVNFTDAACGFKFFRNNLNLKKVIDDTQNKEWFFPIEVLVRAEKNGFNINEIPVIWIDDHDSKVKIIKLSIKYFQEINRLKKEFKLGR